MATSSGVPATAGYVPSCSSVSAGSYSAQEAGGFDPLSYNGYYKSLWPSVLPGVVLGALAIVAFLFFLVWLCVQSCHRRPPPPAGAKGGSSSRAAGDSAASLLSGREYSSQYLSPAPRRVRCSAALSGEQILRAGSALLALALAGVCGWGLAASMQATDDPIPSFWTVVDAAQAKVDTATATLRALSGQMGQLSDALAVLSAQAPRLSPALASLGASQADIDLMNTAPGEVQAELVGLRQGVADGLQLLQDKGNQTLVDLRSSAYPVTNDIDERWRFILIAVAFGLAILFGAAAGLLTVVWMGRWPRAASTATALLWLAVALLMFLGVGLVRGAYEVAQDGCLYAEPFALRYVAERLGADTDTTRLLAAMLYFFGFQDIPDDQVAETLVGAPTRQLQAALQSTEVQSVLGMIAPLGQDLVMQVAALVGVSQNDTASVLQLPALVPALQQSVSVLEQQLQRPNIVPVYQSAKEWVCCTAAGSAWDVWVAWTVAGCVGWALGALCSVRVVLHTLAAGKAARIAQALLEDATAQPLSGLPPVSPLVSSSPTATPSAHPGAGGMFVLSAVAAPPGAAPPLPAGEGTPSEAVGLPTQRGGPPATELAQLGSAPPKPA